ncbi:hypothetical protein MJO28_017114 [Puccinia striiformis f. sp. tritici]|uniref:Uncharacterized protein n=2 Tax=Puccinia striiformis TaxID=27350 RepID=A0A0L0VLM1_9BASI|nr:hypothetical protein Pst134EA_005586 [Puccinia striiformis f. sp. tritici]KNF00174.1 hypothetical protein PSTG_06584 [Puccinia striiformis f. sp. tritici PST-78]POW08074.1 hypothetical protein PSHT_09710 [Puccinia striiformis]KAH9462780.1 hypothetical protein Pst134EB_006655 [Puccinia striiformis f. sp. tritici]KAH9471707.1 hypothetical protein Pst134EA_005586 [Puccinia striiformis f. sp. tritici]KAI7934131.1 hypothetical protein MJO29_016562 [Puccinia striiformis f. sp. tritici]
MIRPSVPRSWRAFIVHPAVLFYLIIVTILGPTSVEARECFWYNDSLGRRRRRCRGLIPGIIAALVVGFFVIMAFLSLAFVLRRRQRRAVMADGPVFTQAPPNNNTTNHTVMSQQPPAYPPPSYPSVPPPIPPPAAYYKLEKNENNTQDPIVNPNPAHPTSFHPSHQ